MASGDLDAIRLEAAGRDAVVSLQGIGEREDLTAIRGIGQRLDVADEAGVKHHLAAHLGGRAERAPEERAPIGQNEATGRSRQGLRIIHLCNFRIAYAVRRLQAR